MGSFIRLLLVAGSLTSSVVNTYRFDSMEDKDLAVTEAFKERWRHIFNNLDRNKDGTFTLNECYSFVKQLNDLYHPREDLIQGLSQYCLLYKDIQETYFGVDGVTRAMTKSEYVSAHGWYWSTHFKIFRKRILTFFTIMFQVMDSDIDGGVSFDEFYHFYEQFGDLEFVMDKAREDFNLIDDDGDGVIAEDEYLEVYLMYHLDPDITANELPIY